MAVTNKSFPNLLLSIVYDFWSPVPEEAKHFLLVIALSLFQEAGVLDMNHLPVFIKDNEDRESETAAIVEPFHQGLCLLMLFLTF